MFKYDVATSLKDRENSILKQCKWKGVEIPCSAIFKKFPTDQGLCCSFNMKAADEIFHAGTYSQNMIDLQVSFSSMLNNRIFCTHVILAAFF